MIGYCLVVEPARGRSVITGVSPSRIIRAVKAIFYQSFSDLPVVDSVFHNGIKGTEVD